MLTIVTVLKNGGEYTPYHVDVLKRYVEKYISVEHKFVCLSNENFSEYVIPLENDWPKWWPKMEIFKIPPPALYFDLDTIIIKEFTKILDCLSKTKFACLRNDYHKYMNRNGDKNSINSSLMFWSENTTYLYEKFNLFPEENMRIFHKGGDQAYIGKNIKIDNVTFIQDILPDDFKSYKFDYLKTPQCIDKASVIYFHGKPRPWEQTKIPYDNI